MSVEARFTVASDSIPLGPLFEEYPTLVAELERIVPTGRSVTPSIWISGVAWDQQEHVVEHLERESSVDGVELVDRFDNECLVEVEWNVSTSGVVGALVNTDVIVLSAVGSRHQWRLKLRAHSRDALANFQRRCDKYEIPIELRSIREQGPQTMDVDGLLTEKQRNALIQAYDRGYFDSPRRASLEDVADDLGVTRQSLAGLLKRGHRALIAGTIAGE
ncbi:helix-turn-helix domain-containing protein [Halobaculum marinum]|uniref:Helix-turn-helix domain-containing protein n=1 Tax=Halobaculum marinum TaxID=3031996 RepID=A0ABD5WQK7_9EURY|nr:helix-turn-helix domain-containing protein [Halobaculum sp. DT55]